MAELAEEEEKHRELLEHVSVGKVFQENGCTHDEEYVPESERC